MRSRRPAVRVHPTPPIGPTDRPKDSNQRVRLTESQTRRETPHPSSLAYETGTGDVAGAAGRAAAEGSGVFGCRRTKSAVSCSSAFGLRSGSMWLLPSIVATLASAAVVWSLLLNLHRVSEFFCARELIVSSS
jgi:hypothetical protein